MWPLFASTNVLRSPKQLRGLVASLPRRDVIGRARDDVTVDVERLMSSGVPRTCSRPALT